jgi:multidrug transporter EmrE-like cation transporter
MKAASSRWHPRRVLTLAWIALIGAEILTQLSLKFAGQDTGGFDFSAPAFVRAVGSGWLWIAIASYCAIFLAWMLILRDSDLSRAFPTSAIVFVAVMLASSLVLHEPMGAMQMLGAAVIVAGILQLRQAESTIPLQASAAVPPSPTSME